MSSFFALFRRFRKLPMHRNKVVVVTFVGLDDGGYVSRSYLAAGADDVFWPHRQWLPVESKPDIGEHPRPAAIAVLKRMDLYGAMMEPSGLLDKFDLVACPTF